MGPVWGLLIECLVSGSGLPCVWLRAVQSWTWGGSKGLSPSGDGRATVGPAGPSCPRPGGGFRLSDGQEGGAEAS